MRSVPKVACAGTTTSRKLAPWETLILMTGPGASPSLRCTSIPPGRTSHSPSASLPPDLPLIILPSPTPLWLRLQRPTHRLGSFCAERESDGVREKSLVARGFCDGWRGGLPGAFPPGEAREGWKEDGGLGSGGEGTSRSAVGVGFCESFAASTALDAREVQQAGDETRDGRQDWLGVRQQAGVDVVC